MENNELFQTIERLKESLSEVESARKQVSETVAAYSNTQKEIDSYVNKLNGIESSLKNVISLIQNDKVLIDIQTAQSVEKIKTSCDTIVNNTDSVLSNCANKFTSASEESLTKMKGQQDLFDKTIEKAASLKNDITALTTSVKAIQEDLLTSQKAQDVAIENIDKAQVSMSAQLKMTDGTVQNVVSSLSENGNTLNQLKQNINNLSNLINQLKTEQSQTKNITNNIKQTQKQLSQQVSTISNSVNTNNINLHKKINVLQFFAIMQLLASIITIIILFVIK